MKIMWITAMSVSDVLIDGEIGDINTSGGWIETTFLHLKNKIDDLVIVSVRNDNINSIVTNGTLTVYKIKGKIYDVFPQKKLKHNLYKVIKSERPDLIDVQGIEFDFSFLLSTIKNINCPIVYTLQGIASEIAAAYFLSPEIVRMMLKRSLHDNLTLHGTLEHAILLYLRGQRGKRTLRGIKHTIGRTEWDKNVALKYNSHICYHHVDRLLRPDFYGIHNWDIEKIIRHSIYVPQITTVLKGGHLFFKIIKRLVERYPDLIVWIPGEKINEKKDNILTGFEKYILKNIRKNNLQRNIKFVGELNAKQIITFLRKANLFLQVSLIENSSNALAEAQIVGTPCVASDVGGTSTYVKDGETGLLYDLNDIDKAVNYIIKVFENDSFAKKLSIQEISTAEKRHERKRNTNELAAVYDDIINARN